jgi:hypothetical protein
MTAGHYISTAARLSAMRTAPRPDGEAIKEAYIALCGSMSDRYDQQARRRGKFKWLRAIVGSPQPVTREHLMEHLAGTATYAATFADAEGMTKLVVADDDHKGVAVAQAAVNYLAQLGIPAWAIARRSLDDTGAPRHDGSRLFILLDQYGHIDQVRPAVIELLRPSGYSVDEVMKRSELPFGRSKWTPAGDEYGQLVLAGHAPRRIESGTHGLQMLRESGVKRTSLARILEYTPAPTPKPTPPVKREYTGSTIINGHADVVRAFNESYTVADVLDWAGWKRIGRRNYRCGCGRHKSADRMPSIGLETDNSKAYFNTPGCTHYRDDKRGYTPFGLYQTITFGGEYKATVREARAMLNMPWDPERKRQEPTLRPATIATKAPATIAEIIDTIKARLDAGQDPIIPSEVDTLREITRLCKQTGTCTVSADALAELVGLSAPTVRRNVAKLVHYGYIAKHANATARGQHAPNVLEILRQNVPDPAPAEVDDHYPPYEEIEEFDKSIVNPIKEEDVSGIFENDPPTLALFNSPGPNFKQLPTITRPLSYDEIDEIFYGGTKGDQYITVDADERKRTGQAWRKKPGNYDPYVEPRNCAEDPDMSAPRLRPAVLPEPPTRPQSRWQQEHGAAFWNRVGQQAADVLEAAQ